MCAGRCAACAIWTRVVLQVKIDPELLGGFVLEVQGVTYDRSVKGRLERLAKGLEKGASVSESMEELMGSLRDTVKGFQIGQDTSETGRVLEVGDGIATVRGLDRAVYGELVEFDTGVKGMVMDLSRETVGCVLLGREEGLGEGSRVTRTGHPADVPVGRALLGRVVDAMGPSHRRLRSHPCCRYPPHRAGGQRRHFPPGGQRPSADRYFGH